MRTLLGDLRYALRTLWKSPGFTLIAILSISLGIGANTAMFSFVDALVLRPLPVKNPGSIIAVHATSPGARLDQVSYPDYADLRDRSKTLESVAAFSSFPAGISATREALPKMTLGYMVSGNFFSGLGIETPIGRGFREDEDRVENQDQLIVVISHSLWEEFFHSDPNVAGRTLRLNGAVFTVIGVASADFTGPEAYVQPDIYVPIHCYKQAAPMIVEPNFLTSRKLKPIRVFARLKPGANIKTAQAEATAIAHAVETQYPETNRDRTMTVLTYERDRYEQDSIDVILGVTLMGITGMVLLIACANVANLLLARGTARVKEIAIRMAIGAGRGALVRQLLTESMVLAALGGVAGVALGYGGVRFLQSIKLPLDFPIDLGIRMDTRLLIFGLGLAAVTGIVFGLVPALRATRMELGTTMKASDQGPAKPGFWGGRLAGRNVLVIVQLALSVVLLVASAMFVRGFGEARKMNPGFRVDHTLLVSFDASLIRYDETKSRAFYKTLIENVRTLPGVVDASLADNFPFGSNVFTRGVAVDGYQPRVGQEKPYSFANIVDDHYFATMESKLVRGRAFDARDTATSPRVVILNEAAAQKFFPNRDALGAQFRLDSATGPLVQVVGIAKTGTYLYWAEPPTPFLWMPFTQDYGNHVTLHVHTKGDPPALSAAIRDVVRKIDPDMPVFSVRSMEAFYDAKAMLGPRLTMQLVTTAGLMGLLLSVIGLYGVVAYAVSRRTREIGIRMAIGARPGDVLRMILSQGLAFTVVGLVAGLTIAFFASRAISGFVIGVSPHDPAIFLGVPVILAAVMLLASWLPAWRASKVDPTLALRSE
ncbi:MAG TPA: ABC transporter permease [Bryobacteraceae bacterium]|nr:ABC transporter permease [Bryobacteraceae bacterium]